MSEAFPGLDLQVVRAAELPSPARAEVLALCGRAYGEDLTLYLDALDNPAHILARVDGEIVSHACWVTRWLQAGIPPPLRTAYIELVATDPRVQRRGLATAVMRRLAESITDYDLGALCPSDAGMALYAAMGWETWHGRLYIRSSRALIHTPEEHVMILRLSGTPPLDLHATLSAEWRPGELW